MEASAMSKFQVFTGSLLALLVDFFLALAANSISALVEEYFGTTDLMVPLFLVFTTILLLILRAVVNTLDGDRKPTSGFSRLSLSSDFFNWILLMVWGQFVLVLGIAATVGAIVLLVRNGIYPDRIELKSLVFWGKVMLWCFTLIPVSFGLTYYEDKMVSAAEYKVYMKVKWNWPKWQRAIERLKRNNMVHQEWLQKRMPGHSEAEVKEAMRLYAREFNVDLEVETFTEEIPNPYYESGVGLPRTQFPRTTYPGIRSEPRYSGSGMTGAERLSSSLASGYGESREMNRYSVIEPKTITVTRTKYILKWND